MMLVERLQGTRSARDKEVITAEDPGSMHHLLHSTSSTALTSALMLLQVLFRLFQLQLHLQYWDKEQARAATERLRELVDLGEWPQELAALRLQAQLHFRILQVSILLLCWTL
jgi:hypothetical protein